MGRIARFAAVAAICAAVLAPAPSFAAEGDPSFDARYVEVSESAGDVSVTLRRPATAALSDGAVAYETVDRGATAYEDYIPARGRVLFAVGQTAASITIFLSDDDEVEPALETVVVRVTDTAGSSRIIDEATVVLRDDDRVRPAAVAASSASDAAPAMTAPPSAAVAAKRRPVASRPRPTRQQQRAVAPRRVTSLELRAEERPTPLPDPAPATPRLAAGLLGALALGRVAAEVWYRVRAGTV